MKNNSIMRRLYSGKNSDASSNKGSTAENQSLITVLIWKCGLNWLPFMGIAVACLMGLSGLFSITVVLQDIQSNSLWSWSEKAVIPVQHTQVFSPDVSEQSSGIDKDGLPVAIDKDNLHPGIEKDNLPSGIEKDNVSAGIKKDNLPVETKKDNLPSGIEKDNLPVGTEEDNLPVGTEKDKLSPGIEKDNLPAGINKDNLHSGIEKDNSSRGQLATRFEKITCHSRNQSSSYRKESPHKPSTHLLSKLKAYEDLHKRCGPNTESYNKIVKHITSTQQHDSVSDCNYLVWISSSNIGNRILSIASAFLYALLTNRVLLIDRGTDATDLFCEPFPDTSWLLPLDFPLIKQFHNFDQYSPVSHGNMLRNYIITNSTLSYPPYIYLHLAHDYDDYDKLFFCDEDQSFLHEVPWLIMNTDNYFIPSLFLIPSFEKQLNDLFPQKDTVFHFMGRYLFHPTNSVWGLITRYYDTYLANADERVGIHVQVSDPETGLGPGPSPGLDPGSGPTPGPLKHILDQIVACTVQEGILPQHSEKEVVVSHDAKPKLKTILVTSLSSGYSDILKNKYWEKPTFGGEVVSVYQPSFDEFPQPEKLMHNKKAWAEMYLLSMSDVLVTSSCSSFGYVAQGLGGLKPWILHKPENQTVPDPPCRRGMSMEPCFHTPPLYLCREKEGADTGQLVPHVKHCEDMNMGLKLIDV